MSVVISTPPPQQQRVAFERASGYSGGVSKVFDGTRHFKCVMLFRGSGRGVIAIIPDEDIAYNKTWSVLVAPSSGTAPGCVTDRDDTTGCGWSVGANTAVDVLRVDLGAATTGFLRFHWYTTAPSLRVSGSKDSYAWTLITEISKSSGVYEDFVYVDGYRYLRFGFRNPEATAYSAGYRTIELYPDVALPFAKILDGVNKRVVGLVYGAHYQLIEVITI
jgi:hypothetical protein